jgi:signal transduction histidine kinase
VDETLRASENAPVSSLPIPLRDPARTSVPGPARSWPTGMIQRLAERSEREVAEHPLLCDAGLSALVALAAVAGLASQDRLDARQLAFTAAFSLMLLLRRRQPLSVFAAIALIAALQWLIAAPQLGDAALLIALYGVALRGSIIELVVAATVLEAGAVMAAVKWAPSDPVKIWIGLTGLAVAAGVLGITVRQRRALLASLHERAGRLEAEREEQARLAAAAERNRIAREMHDIVAHNLSVMIALADGASYAIETSPAQASLATGQISVTGRDALSEMRRLLGVLRDGESAQTLQPQPRLAELERMVERVRAAGIPVELAVAGDTEALGEGVQLAVFRVAQEALTNTLKHASRPTSVRVSVLCGEDRVELEVSDTGGPPDVGAAVGRGIRGMRERANAYGGELQAGPRPEGGWRVLLRLGAPGERR